MVHFYRNVFSHVPTTKVREVSHMLKAIHAQESRNAADRKARAIVDDLRAARMNTAADLVERSVSETLTYYAFPDIHWEKIRTNNPLERIMKEIRRRTRVVGAFPDGQSCLNLAAARLRYIAGTAWSAKCYMRPGADRRGDRPEVPFLCASAARIEHGATVSSTAILAEPRMSSRSRRYSGLSSAAALAHPECQRRAFDRDALAQQHLGLAIQRQMPSIFGNQDRGHHRLGRQPALDQPFQRWCLDHALFAGPAGVLGTMRHDHPILGGDDVETLGGYVKAGSLWRSRPRRVPKPCPKSQQ